MRLADKRILLGVSGGIAAYKSAELVRRLKDQGAEVRVVMTRSAKEFITPLTLQAVSGHPVADSLLDPAAEAGMGHIELAKWADLVLIAPASANLMARMAAGNVGITEPLRAATEQSKATLLQGQNAISGRQQEMQRALMDEQQARREAASAEEAKARVVGDAVRARTADEEKLRSLLAEASQISPERYWDSQGGTGAKFAAAAGLLVSGLAGPAAVESTAANINRQIDRHVDSQVAAYNAKLGLAREVRAQWDKRVETLGSIEDAKISAKMQAIANDQRAQITQPGMAGEDLR